MGGADRVGARLNVAIAVLVTMLVVLVALLAIELLGDDDPVASEGGTPTSTTTTTTTAAAGEPLVAVDPSVTDPETLAVVRTFLDYVGAINAGDHGAAYGFLTEGLRSRRTFEEFAGGIRTTTIADFVVEELSTDGGTGVLLGSFRSTQEPEDGVDGQACSLWALEYELVRDADGVWRIDRAAAGDESPVAC